MNNFTFYSPTLFTFGDGEEKNTGALVRRFGGSRVLLVTGGGSVRRNGAYDAVTASLEAAGIPFTELSGVQANPRSGKVYEGIDLVRRRARTSCWHWAAAVSSTPPRPSASARCTRGISGISSPAPPRSRRRCPWAWC